MSIEQHLQELTAAIKENTAAILASGGKAGATTSTETTKSTTTKTSPRGTAADKKPAAKTTTVEEARGAVSKIATDFGKDEARAVMSAHGFANLAAITAEKADAVFGDAEEAHARLTEAAKNVDVEEEL